MAVSPDRLREARRMAQSAGGPDAIARARRRQRQREATLRLPEAAAMSRTSGGADALARAQRREQGAPPLGQLGSDQVRQVQRELRAQGFYTGAIDGIWGPKTEWAYRASTGKSTQALSPNDPYSPVNLRKTLEREQARIRQEFEKLRGQLSLAGFAGQEETAAAFRSFAQSQLRQIERPTELTALQRETRRLGAEQRAWERRRARAQREQEEEAQEEAAQQPPGGWRGWLDTAGRWLGYAAEVAVQRPYYAAQLRENRQLAEGDGPLSLVDIGQTWLGSWGVESLSDEEGVAAAEAVDTQKERQQLTRAGELESFGQRVTRAGNELGLQVAAWLGNDSAQRRLENRDIDSFQDYGTRRNTSGVASGTIDAAFNIFADPLNLVPGLGALGKLDDAAKAARLAEANPTALNSILNAAGRAAETAAARSDGGRYLQALIPSLRGKEAGGLVGAVTTGNADRFAEYADDFVQKYTTDVATGRAAGLRARTAAEAARLGQEAASQAAQLAAQVRQAGRVTQGARRQLLELELGRTWQPQVGPTTRALYRGVGATGRVTPGLASAALAVMPATTRAVKLDSMRFSLGRRLRGGERGAYLGRRVRRDPNTGALTRHARQTSDEADTAADAYRAFSQLDPHERVQAARDVIRALPPSSIRRALTDRLDRLSRMVPDPADWQRYHQLRQKATIPEDEWKRIRNRIRRQVQARLGIPRLRRDVRALNVRIRGLESSGSPVPANLREQLDNLRGQLRTAEDQYKVLVRREREAQRLNLNYLSEAERREFVRLDALHQSGNLRPRKHMPRELAGDMRRLGIDLSRIVSAGPEYYERLRRNYELELRDWAARGGAPLKPRWSRWHKAWLTVPRLFNTVPTTTVNLHLPAERAEEVRNWVIGMGGSGREADEAFSRMLEPAPVEEVIQTAKGIQEDMLQTLFERGGLTKGEIQAAMRELRNNPTRFFRENKSWSSVLDDLSKRLDPYKNEPIYGPNKERSPVVLSQSQYTFVQPDPQDVRRYIRELKAQRSAFRRALETPAMWGSWLISGYYTLHRAWKFAALCGAPIRYILRVHMDERLRMFMAHGFAGLWMPRIGLQRKLNARLLDQNFGLRSASHFDEVGVQGVPEHLLDYRGIKVTGHDVLTPDDPEFIPNAWHIVCRQVKPEDDMVQNLLMHALHRGDRQLMREAHDSAKEWLVTTRTGRHYLEKAVQLNKKNQDLDYLLENTQQWLEEVLPAREVVEARLQGLFSLSTYRENPDWHPSAAWGETFTRLYRPDRRDPRPHWVQWAQRLTLSSPTTALSRNPFYYREFCRQWDALVMNGMNPRQASIEASRQAVRRTNAVLFDAGTRSRFAQKTELFSPFAQAREEQIIAWGRLIRENPARAAKIISTVALALNNGLNNEVIVEDPFGAWTMKVPGSPELSRALGRWAPQWIPFREGFKSIAGSGYSFRLRDLLFTQDVWSVVPRPGGLWWTAASNFYVSQAPQTIPDNDFFREYFFGFGAGQKFWPRPEIAEAFMALTGSTSYPLEPLAGGWVELPGGREPEFEKVRDRLGITIRAELIRQAVEEGRDPLSVTPEAVAEAVRAQLLLNSAMGMVFPAATRVEQVGEQDWKDAQERYRDKATGEVDYDTLVQENPELIGYSLRYRAYTDPVREQYSDDNGDPDIEAIRREHPEYWDRWFKDKEGREKSDAVARLKDQLILARDYMDDEQFRTLVEDTVKLNRAWEEFHAIQSSATSTAEKILRIDEWEQRFRDKGDAYGIRLRNYARDQALAEIMKAHPNRSSSSYDEALREWRYRFNVSESYANRLIQGQEWLNKDLWLEARTFDELQQVFLSENGNPKGLSPQSWAEDLGNPAEAVRFLRGMAGAQEDVESYKDLNGAAFLLSEKYQHLLYGQGRGKTYADIQLTAAEWWSAQQVEPMQLIDQKYDQVGVIDEQLTQAYEAADAATQRADAANEWDPNVGKLWDTYWKLKDRKNRVFAEIKGIRDSLYKKHPVLETIADEVRYMHLIENPEFEQRSPAYRQALLEREFGFHTPVEQASYKNQPPHIQQDYVETLIEQLTLEPDQYQTDEGAGRMLWEWLTNFQKDLVESRATEQQLDLIKHMSELAKQERAQRGGKQEDWGGGGWEFGDLKIGEGAGFLAFAVELFKEYNRRGDMPEPTKELEEFRALGDNKLARAAYLKAHPRLQEWFRLGPMNNMPPGLAQAVRYIMVTKLGRWDGDAPETWDEATEVGYANYLLEKYNNRKSQEAPTAYDRWLEMPTGPERYRYMQQHPEIAEWLQNGPMARMPEAYREVVRDIQTKYKNWTERTDPLSVLLEQYYAVPSYAKQDFLQEHPEILAYWRAIRSDEERRVFDMAQTYFALPDDEKRAYIRAHPEVQEYFIQQRRKNYERFLERVAVYLGSAPELAEEYMENQTQFIRELVEKFGQRLLVAPRVTVSARREATGRQPVRANRRVA